MVLEEVIQVSVVPTPDVGRAGSGALGERAHSFEQGIAASMASMV